MPVALEPPQRLADRRAAGGEALGELLLDEPLAVRELAGEQRRAQAPCGPVRRGSTECLDGQLERLHRRVRDAAADLADAGLPVRDPGVDRRRDPRVATTLRASMPSIAARPSG